MPNVAVVAHSRKSFGGGLRELRKVLVREGVADPLWYEVRKSRHAPLFSLVSFAPQSTLYRKANSLCSTK